MRRASAIVRQTIRMYNGVGLPTPRGSGTSGFVQQNRAFVSRPRTWLDFKKEFEQIKANPPKPPKKPNAEIIEHEQKRQIEVHLLLFQDKLLLSGLPSADIAEKVGKARDFLYSKLRDAPLLSRDSSHSKVAEKEKEMLRLKEAFGIMEDYVPGAAFDFEAIEERHQKEKEEKQMKKALEAREQTLALAKAPTPPRPKSPSPKRSSKKRPSPRSRSRHHRSSSSSSSSSSASRSSSSSHHRRRSPPRHHARRHH